MSMLICAKGTQQLKLFQGAVEQKGSETKMHSLTLVTVGSFTSYSWSVQYNLSLLLQFLIILAQIQGSPIIMKVL